MDQKPRSFCAVVVAIGSDVDAPPASPTWGLIWYPGTKNWLWIDFSVYSLEDAQRRGAWGMIRDEEDDHDDREDDEPTDE